MANPTEAQVRQRAHQLWELAGRPEGREQDFWYESERELSTSAAANSPDEKSGIFLE